MIENKQNFEADVKYRLAPDAEIDIESHAFDLMAIVHHIDTYFMVNEIIDGKPTYIRLREYVGRDECSFDRHVVIDDFTTELHEISLTREQANKVKESIDTLENEVVCVVNKLRSTYGRAGVSIMLDRVEGLGNFIEIELHAEENNRHHHVNTLENVARELGLKPENAVYGLGYPDLLIKQ